MKEAAVVYHRPGSVEGYRLIERLIGMLEAVGVSAEAYTIEEALERAPGLVGRRVFLLLFTRGGHWYSLVEAGLKPLLIPLHLTASAIARRARTLGQGTGCRVLLAALQAHRLRAEQSRDLEVLARLLAIYQCSTRLALLRSLHETVEPQKGEVVAPLALLPGRLVAAACSRGACLGAFAEYALEDLAAWIASTTLREI